MLLFFSASLAPPRLSFVLEEGVHVMLEPGGRQEESDKELNPAPALRSLVNRAAERQLVRFSVSGFVRSRTPVGDAIPEFEPPLPSNFIKTIQVTAVPNRPSFKRSPSGKRAR